MISHRIIGVALLLVAVNAGAVDVRLYTEHYPPFSIETETGVSGINTALLRQSFEDLGLTASFQVESWARAQASSLRFDNACLYSAARTEERETLYQWVGPLTREHVSLFRLHDRDIRITSLSDAGQFRVGGQQRDFYTEWMIDQGIEVDAISGDASNVERLLRGRIDLWIAGSIGGPYMAAFEHDALVTSVYQAEEVMELWLACSRGVPPMYIKDLNERIDQYREDGTLTSIQSGYLTTPERP